MNHWLETSKRNLPPLSISDDFKEALSEWFFTNKVYPRIEEFEMKCELCEHPELSNHFEIENKYNSNKLRVGSSCIYKFPEINVTNKNGQLVTDIEERQRLLEEALNQNNLDLIINPLRQLWRVDKENRELIRYLANKIKSGGSISPNNLLFLFESMDNYSIKYYPQKYKISLRKFSDQFELNMMHQENLEKIKPSLSNSQLKTYSLRFLYM